MVKPNILLTPTVLASRKCHLNLLLIRDQSVAVREQLTDRALEELRSRLLQKYGKVTLGVAEVSEPITGSSHLYTSCGVSAAMKREVTYEEKYYNSCFDWSEDWSYDKSTIKRIKTIQNILMSADDDPIWKNNDEDTIPVEALLLNPYYFLNATFNSIETLSPDEYLGLTALTHLRDKRNLNAGVELSEPDENHLRGTSNLVKNSNDTLNHKESSGLEPLHLYNTKKNMVRIISIPVVRTCGMVNLHQHGCLIPTWEKLFRGNFVENIHLQTFLESGPYIDLLARYLENKANESNCVVLSKDSNVQDTSITRRPKSFSSDLIGVSCAVVLSLCLLFILYNGLKFAHNDTIAAQSTNNHEQQTFGDIDVLHYAKSIATPTRLSMTTQKSTTAVR